jgi:hypothetical protein
VHSLVLELTGKKNPPTVLQVVQRHHGCAAGLTFGRAAEDEFSDGGVNRADMVALRRSRRRSMTRSTRPAPMSPAVLTASAWLCLSRCHRLAAKPDDRRQPEAKFHGL